MTFPVESKGRDLNRNSSAACFFCSDVTDKNGYANDLPGICTDRIGGNFEVTTGMTFVTRIIESTTVCPRRARRDLLWRPDKPL